MEPNEIISSGLLELYVLGMTNEQESARVLDLCKQFPEVENERLAIEDSLEHYARIHCINPSVKLKEKIYTAINNDNQSKIIPVTVQTPDTPVVHAASFWKFVAAASVILLVGSLLMNYNYYTKYETAENERLTLKNEKSNIEQQLAAQQQSNEEMKNDLNVVQSKYSEPHSLNGLPETPDAKAKIFWMKNTGDVYIDASNLPDPPDGMQYQFWGIVDGKPVDGGMIIITKKQDKYRIQKMRSFGKAEAFAVTLETMGGNPQPKGQMFVMGKM